MPPRSKIMQLPEEDRRWLDKALIDGNFCAYQDLEIALAERGYEIGKSSINRYGQKLESKLAAIKASTEAATAIAEAAPDDSDLRSAAVMSLVQTEIFDVLVNLQDASDEDVDQVTRVKLLSQAAKNIATLSRASVNQKKWQQQMETKIREQERQRAAETATAAAKAGGASADTVKKIRQALGIEA